MNQKMSIIPHTGVRPLPDVAFTVVDGRTPGAREQHGRRRSGKGDGYFHEVNSNAASDSYARASQVCQNYHHVVPLFNIGMPFRFPSPNSPFATRNPQL